MKQALLYLPFLTSPYPDEILGSWLFRLQVHNHVSPFKQFVREIAQRNIDRSEWRDINNQSPALNYLLESLGTTYNRAMLDLTTYPYWLRFHSSKQFSWTKQEIDTGIPTLILKDRRETIPRLRYLLPYLIKLCPICLTNDFKQYGEPYLHRAHHLPFVNVCYKHEVPLISKCPRCYRIFRMESTFIYARIFCECGFDLRQTQPLENIPLDPWKQLACYSADVLFSKELIYECTHVYQYFDLMLSKYRVAKGPDLLAFLTRTYGSTEAKALLTLAPQRSTEYSHSQIRSVSKQDFRAPQICAFLAAVDFGFVQSHSRFTSFMESKDPEGPILPEETLRSTYPKIPGSITEARAYVAEIGLSVGKTTLRSHLYQRYKTLFWYLTLFDKDWFECNYPPRRRGATKQLPSIEEDRCSILQAIDRASSNSARIWKNYAQQASFRALLRDSEWLNERKCDTAQKEQLDRSQRKLLRYTEFIQDIKQAIAKIRATKGESHRISLSEIAPYTALNRYQLQRLVISNPDIRLLYEGPIPDS